VSLQLGSTKKKNMKLIRFGAFENETPGVLTADGKRLDVSAFGEDYNEKFFATNGLERLEAWLKTNDCPEVSESERLGSCVARPSKIICIGLNYAKHAAESGMDVPKEPVVFFKATTALCGPNDDVVIPRNSVKTNWQKSLLHYRAISYGLRGGICLA
jgi:2,4-didehydro-3-deoxy-L-rhamnonate hydrolase